MKNEIKTAYTDWIDAAIADKKAVAFTLNFRSLNNGKRLTEERALATVRRYYNGLCRTT